MRVADGIVIGLFTIGISLLMALFILFLYKDEKKAQEEKVRARNTLIECVWICQKLDSLEKSFDFSPEERTFEKALLLMRYENQLRECVESYNELVSQEVTLEQVCDRFSTEEVKKY